MADDKHESDHLDESQNPPRKKKKAQSAPHKRGGVHPLDEEYRTPSEEYNRLSLTQAMEKCKERGIWIKDTKKGVAIQMLWQYDQKNKAKQPEVPEQFQDAIARKRREREDNIRREKEREERERVLKGDSSNEDDEFERFEVFYEGISSEDCSSASEGEQDPARDARQFNAPDGSLRLFEWVYPGMPSETFLVTPDGQTSYFTTVDDAVLVRRVLYFPLNVVTETLGEEVQLPGRQRDWGDAGSRNAEPRYVPSIPRRTREAARNGVLEGVLENAVIERGLDWAQRTSVQGSNGSMYFKLPPPDLKKDLRAVYEKHQLQSRQRRKKYKFLARQKYVGDTAQMKEDRKQRQKRRNKRRRLKEVYETSRGQVKAMCYVPAYLDSNESLHRLRHREPTKSRTLDRLFFIRFNDDQVPSYYFWGHKSQWSDPTTPNPRFKSSKKRSEDAREDPVSDMSSQASATPPMSPTKSSAQMQKEKLDRYEQTWFHNNKAGWIQFLQGLQRIFPSELFDDVFEAAMDMTELPEIPYVDVPPGATVEDLVDVVQLWAESNRSDLENVFDDREDDDEYDKWDRVMLTVERVKQMQVLEDIQRLENLMEAKKLVKTRIWQEKAAKAEEKFRKEIERQEMEEENGDDVESGGKEVGGKEVGGDKENAGVVDGEEVNGDEEKTDGEISEAE